MANDTALMGGGGYGNYLRESNATIRDFGELSVSAVAVTANGVNAGLKAVAGKTYSIWGATLTTSSTTAFGGLLEDTAGTDLMAGVCNVNGPFAINLEVPITVTKALGVQFNSVAGHDKNSYLTLYYTEKDDV